MNTNTKVGVRVLHSTIMRGDEWANACGAPVVEWKTDQVSRSIPCVECGDWFSRQEASIKPDFEKVIGQWTRGLITNGELVSALDDIHSDAPVVP